MAKVGYVGNTPDQTSVIIARQIYNITSSTGVVTFNSTYQPGYVDVYLNGVRLVDVLDYSAATGRTINLSADALAGDVLEVVAYKAFDITKSPIGIQSEGNVVKLDSVNTLNFIGAGNTFAVNGTTVDVSIAGGLSTADVNTSSLVVVGLSTLSNVTSGVTTATQFSGSIAGAAATFSGNATFGGNVTIGGVLTYEDVTNIDAIGIITARSGVSIGDSIFHTGDSNTAIRFPAADTFTVETGGDERVRVDSSGNFGVGTVDPQSFLSVKVSASRQLDVIKDSGDDHLVLKSSAPDDSYNLRSIELAGSDVSFSTGSGTSYTQRLIIDASGLVRVPDNGKFTAGAGDDLQIFHDGSDSYIKNDTGQLILRVASVESALVAVPNGAVELYHDNSKKLETSATGVTVTGTVSDSIGDVRYLGTSAAGGSNYTLVASDAGKQVRVSGGYTITIPDNVFVTGSMITIVANSSSNVPITQGSGMTLFNASDGSSGSKTLAARTMCTILYVEGGSGSKAYVSGGGLS